jgi:peptidoglycan hydrolase-like protein with peptidoglycan-binding domain
MAVTAAAVVAALGVAVLSGCGPQQDRADSGKPSGTGSTSSSGSSGTTAPATTAPATTPGSTAPTTPAAPATTPPTTSARPTTPPTTSAPTTRPPAAPAVMTVGNTSAQVRELQARLRQLHLFGQSPTGYYGTVTQHAVSDFQERHGLAATGSVSSATWAKVRSATHQPTHKELYPVATAQPAGKLDPRCLTGHAMCISKTSRTLSWVVDGKVKATMDVRFGAQYTPTREGLFHVQSKHRDWVSTLYNSPMPYAMFFSGGEAVHYSSDFAARGYAGASHGCVNVRDKPALAALFDQVKVGDKVVVYW